MKYLIKTALSVALAALLNSVHAEEPASVKNLFKLDFESDPALKEPGKTSSTNASFSSENSFTGKYSLKGARDDEGKLQFFTLYEVKDIPLKPGCFYKISGAVKCSARVQTTYVPVQMLLAGTEKINENWAPWGLRPGISFLHGKNMAKGWIFGERIMQVPDNCDKGTLRIGAYLAKGDTVFFDNIKLTELPPMVDLLSECLCKDQQVNVSLNVAAFNKNPGLGNISGTLNLIDQASGKAVFSRKIERFDSTVSQQTIDIANLPGGQYEIKFEIFDAAGKSLSSKNITLFICKNQPWMNNKIGVLGPKDDAPPPWKNIEYKKTADGIFSRVFFKLTGKRIGKHISPNIIKTRGVKYTFQPGPLPSQINSAGENILAAPAQIKVETSLGPVDFSACKWKLEKGGKNKGVFSFSNSDKGLLISGTAEIEFDGMIKYTFRLAPAGTLPVKVKTMALEFPLTESASTHFTCPSVHTWAKRSEIEKQTDNWNINSFHPMLWIGSVDRGLCWFAESYGNWKVADAYFECAKNDQGRTFKVNMIDAPAIISKDESPEFVFGIQATPTKPRIKNWQAINFRTPVMKNFEVSWSEPNKDIYFGFPIDNATNEANIKANIDFFRKTAESSGAPSRIIFYAIPQFAALDMSEYRYFKQAWDIPSPRKDTGCFTPIIQINPTDINWQDFLIYYADAKIKKYGYDGLYFDGAGPTKTSEKDWDIFRSREFFKRLYIMVHKNSPNGLIMMHVGNFVPIASFGDVSLSGEQYRNFLVWPKPYYLDFLTLKEFRQEQVVDFGLINILLAQHKGPEREDPKFGAHIMGMALLHNVSVYPGFMPQQVFDDVTSRWIKFGKGKAEFVPYWSEISRAKSNNDSLKISYYEKPDGLFMIAMNVSTGRIDSVVEVNMEGIKISEKPSAAVYIPASNEEQKTDFNGKINITLDKYQPALIEIK